MNFQKEINKDREDEKDKAAEKSKIQNLKSKI